MKLRVQLNRRSVWIFVNFSTQQRRKCALRIVSAVHRSRRWTVHSLICLRTASGRNRSGHAREGSSHHTSLNVDLGLSWNRVFWLLLLLLLHLCYRSLRPPSVFFLILNLTARHGHFLRFRTLYFFCFFLCLYSFFFFSLSLSLSLSQKKKFRL